MKRYSNKSGSSGVRAYEYGADAILVEFDDHGLYLYTYASAGPEHVERMKALADEGRGLSTYIVRHVRKRYERRLR